MLGEHALANPETNDYILCVTGDHTTPVQYGDHTFEPVPIAVGQVSKIYQDLQSKKVASATFDEICCGQATSALGRFPGIETISMLKRYRDSLLSQ